MFLCCGLAALLAAAFAALLGRRAPAGDGTACCERAAAKRVRFAPAAIAATTVLAATVGLVVMLRAQERPALGDAIASSLCLGARLFDGQTMPPPAAATAGRSRAFAAR